MIGGTLLGDDKEDLLSAIRRISGIRTVSDDVVLILAKTIPIDILADAMRRIYLRRLEYSGQIITIKAEE